MGNFERIVEAGRSFACGVYRQQPAALVETPISDVLKVVWDGLCGDVDPGNLPSKPTPPFEGGQCVDVLYDVRVRISLQTVPPNDRFEVVSMPGRVLGLLKQTTPGSGFCYVQYKSSDGVVREVYVHNYSSSTPYDYAIVGVSRADGQPDNCGSLPASYPPSPPPPPGGYTSPPTAVVYNDGTGFNVTFNLKPPSGGDVVSPPPICLGVVLGGKPFGICFSPNGDVRLEGGDNAEMLLRDLQEALREFQEEYERDQHPLPPEQDPSLTPEPLEGDDGGEKDADGLKWLVVSLLEPPDKAQFGTPTVFFAGWVTFRIGEDYTERASINFEKSVFKAPEGASGYGVTFTNHSKGNVVAYTSMKES